MYGSWKHVQVPNPSSRCADALASALTAHFFCMQPMRPWRLNPDQIGASPCQDKRWLVAQACLQKQPTATDLSLCPNPSIFTFILGPGTCNMV